MSRIHPCNIDTPTLIPDGPLLRCGSCGAFQRLNPETGNLTWIRGGRVISAPQDMLEASERHENSYGFGVESDKIASLKKENGHGSR